MCARGDQRVRVNPNPLIVRVPFAPPGVPRGQRLLLAQPQRRRLIQALHPGA